MHVKRLTLTNVRAFRQAEFEFKLGMNLIVGVNGAGKSTVLDVLRRLYANWIPGSTKQPVSWDRDDDITIGQPFMAITSQLDYYEEQLTYSYQLQRETTALNPDAIEGQVREATYDVPQIDDLRDEDNRTISGLYFKPSTPRLVVFFSPHRSLTDTERKTSRSKQDRANNLALEPRGLNVRELAQWWLVQKSLTNEIYEQKPLMPELAPFNLDKALNNALHSFLDTYGEIYPVSKPETSLQIAKGDVVLDVLQLSDGERSMIALVLDLARRLALANPDQNDPLREGRAIVLIDEIDLHLHPGWQRTICQRLTSTFPKCQFIATTHSPQIISEISPENIILIDGGEVSQPSQSFGMDTNWILRHLMGVTPVPKLIEEATQSIEEMIQNEHYDEALEKIAELRKQKHGDSPDLAALEAHIEMIDFLADEIEDDSE